MSIGGNRQPSTTTRSSDWPYFFHTSCATCLSSCVVGAGAGVLATASFSAGVTSGDFGITLSGLIAGCSISAGMAGFSPRGGLG